MTSNRKSRRSMFYAVFFAAPVFAACSGSSEPTGPGGGGGGETQTASATVTPSNGTVSRGTLVATSTTVVITATGGLLMGSTVINKPFPGIAVLPTSTQSSATTFTRVYAISADGSVPVGTHVIRFTAPITGYTGSGTAPTATGTFTLTAQ